jgi:hypothetical protein
MGKNVKTLDFLRWLQLSNRQILSVLPFVLFAMRRPGVRPSSAPPTTQPDSITYLRSINFAFFPLRRRCVAATGNPQARVEFCLEILKNSNKFVVTGILFCVAQNDPEVVLALANDSLFY